MAAASPLVKRSQVIRRSHHMGAAKAADVAKAARVKATASAQRPSTEMHVESGSKAQPLKPSSSDLNPAGGRGKTEAAGQGDKDDVPPQQSDPSTTASSSSPSSSSPSVSSSTLSTSTSAQAPARRSTTRTRKPSSRLLPSPSPPPTRPSSYYNPSKAMHARSASVTSSKRQASNEPTVAERASPHTQPQTQSQPQPVRLKAASSAEDGGFGPGKRKRKPSTMTKPPATITKAPSPSALPAAAERTQSPSPSTAPASATKVRIRLGSRASGNDVSQKQEAKRANLDEKAHERDGYDSDGNAEGSKALLLALAEPDGDQGNEDDSDVGLLNSKHDSQAMARNQRQRLGAPAATGRDMQRHFSPAWRALSLSSGSGSTTEPPPLLSRGGLQQDGKSFRSGMKAGPAAGQKSALVSSSSNINISSSNSSDGSKSKGSRNGSTFVPALRFHLNTAEDGADDESSLSDVDDEDDDFHVAMLDGGGDFDFKVKDEFDSKSFIGSDVEDTPATTPRSPQSTCDLPERRSSSAAEVSVASTSEPKGSERTSHNEDAVFAHALPPSSRRPHTHAGSLTLSLPFNEVGHENTVNEGDEQVLSPPPSATGRDSSSEEVEGQVRVKQAPQVAPGIASKVDDGDRSAANATQEEDEDLLSPSQQDILGLEVSRAAGTPLRSHHNFMMGDPNPSSAFNSPAVIATSAQSLPMASQDPAPLLLPPTSISSTTLRTTARPASPSSGAPTAPGADEGKGQEDGDVSSDDDDDNDDDDDEDDDMDSLSRSTAPSVHEAEENMVLGPPEALCLSELDRAWEQDKYLSEARQVAKLGGPFIAAVPVEDEHEDILSVEEMMDLDRVGLKRSLVEEHPEPEFVDASSEDRDNMVKAKVARCNAKRSPKVSTTKKQTPPRNRAAASAVASRRR